MGGGDQLLGARMVIRLLGACRPGDLKWPRPDDTSSTSPWPSKSDPSQCASAVRIATMNDSSRWMSGRTPSHPASRRTRDGQWSRCPSKHLCRPSTTPSAAMRPSWRSSSGSMKESPLTHRYAPVSRARSCFRRRTASDVPRAVLGRSDDLQRAARASAAAYAPRSLCGDTSDAGPVAEAHAGCDRFDRAQHHSRSMSCGPTWSGPRTRW